jgi:hypothetical protein
MVAAHIDEVLELNFDGTFELPATPTAAHMRKQQEVDACAAKHTAQQQQSPAAPSVAELLDPTGQVVGYQVTVETGDAALQAEQVQVAVSSSAEVVVSWGATQSWRTQLPKSNINASSTQAWLNSGRIIAHVLLL